MKSVKLFSILIPFLFFLTLTAAGFEGSITFVKQTLYDTTYSTFLVKDNLVRIDEKNTKRQVLQSVIVDIQKQNITALCPSQKLYTNVKKNTVTGTASDGVQIIKTKNYKYIDGFKCYQWRVRNVNLNSEISYWVCESGFDFFNSVVALLSKTDDYSKYCNNFDKVPQNSGFFPIMTVERTLLRDEKMTINVQHISHRPVDDKMFKIPSNYKYFRS
jgi:hypothetical protein